MKKRSGTIQRKTKETNIRVRLSPDGTGLTSIKTEVPFLSHMMEAMAKHGRFDLDIRAQGDVELDPHHLVEDTGICLGKSLVAALGKMVGIERFGEATIPMDEALVQVSLDISGRPGYVQDFSLRRKRIGTFDTDLVDEFWKGFTQHAGVTLHIQQIRGRNSHHIIEAAFKGFGRALGLACKRTGTGKIASTKGRI